jgi:hypothetical protein
VWVPRTSIFAVFSEETFQEAALDGRWEATRVLTLDAGYGRRFYSAARDGRDGTAGANRASARATIRFGEQRAGRGLAEVERVEAPDNAFTRLRLATSVPLRLARRLVSCIVDLDLFVLDDATRDTQVSFTGGAWVEVPLRPNVRVMAGGTASTTPLLQQAGTFLLRLTWDFETPSPDRAVLVQRGRLP